MHDISRLVILFLLLDSKMTTRWWYLPVIKLKTSLKKTEVWVCDV